MNDPAPPALRPIAPGQPRVAVVTCAVLADEIRHFAAQRSHITHIELLEQGLHNTPDRLRQALQAAVHRVEAADAANVIVLGYGLCSRGTEGVVARRCRLVIARAHDCITLLLGSKDRYAEYVARHPGTYWYSPGWNRSHIPPGKERYETLYRHYAARYGEDNAEFLMETEQAWMKEYRRAAYVDLGVGVTPQDLTYTQQCAAFLGWEFDRQRGDPGLLTALLDGPWDDQRFCVLEPGQSLRMTADERVVEAVPADQVQIDPTLRPMTQFTGQDVLSRPPADPGPPPAGAGPA